VLILPITLLLAALYALTSHARHNEITAMRAAGISLWRLCLPYLGVGLLASFALLVLNEVYVPESEEAAERIMKRHQPMPVGAVPRNQVRHLCFANNRGHRYWDISLYNTDTSEMLNPLVIWTRPDGTDLWIRAKRAVRTNAAWTFYDVEESQKTPQATETAPYLKTNVLVFAQFSETPDQIKSEIKIASVKDLRNARNSDLSIKEILNYLRLHPDLLRADEYWLYTKLYGRLAAPWTCLVVMLIAIPFGAASGRRNVFVGVASSLTIFLAYYVLQLLGLSFGTAGWVSPWLAAWLPNLVFGLAGLYLTARVR
jgi:lipopolysaccharide export system permease protein